MIIKRSRINKLESYEKLIPPGDDVVVGVVNPPTSLLQEIGFSDSLEDGESVLPPIIGPITRFNAEGRETVHKDQPMETASRTIEWRWIEWHGPDRVEQSDFRDVPYKRYPRTFFSPPSVELTLATDANGNKIGRTPVFTNWKENKDAVLHGANVILEIFGECTFLGGEMKGIIAAPVKKLNWQLLPPGERPWPELKRDLSSLLDDVKGGTLAFTEHRLEVINSYKPDFAAVGQNGFRGYVILGFKDKNLYVLESLFYGNATYVFQENWEALSKKTKAEILSQGLQHTRFIHHRYWQDDVKELLNS
jgi:hypothetical protein